MINKAVLFIKQPTNVYRKKIDTLQPLPPRVVKFGKTEAKGLPCTQRCGGRKDVRKKQWLTVNLWSVYFFPVYIHC